MYSKKKLLVETVFETAKKELPRASINSLSNYLSSLFDERYDFSRDERSFTRYYKSLIQDGEDYNIDDITLLYLSKYIGYKDFEDFCSKISIEGGDGSTTFKLGFSDTLSEQTPQVSITINPTFKMPEFMKKNGMGIMEIALLLCFTTGSIAFSKKPNTQAPGKGFAGILDSQLHCMYWDKSEYKPINCQDKNPMYNHRVPFDYEKMEYFKRIERKDTLTVDNAYGKVWYSKYNGEVDFFTDDGVDPNNGRELRKATEYIIDKYGGIQEEGQ
ncbi:hypothetical protein AB670_00457 [Chryseobacterium sp. MOF25P]|uniref:hypothetical protein n=1 Tax=unclassified Chryseobacterium TaxID=2593645 RepID=UPI0008047A9E|nr:MULTISPECIES: hypothetical protein [unclassified Chryseobacterium]OBW43264.1 hypothetical protein AB670_00457 [Chryseobacterium sp. MOF25P]OBW46474.1 hypothetical protein AB671_01389 [Chryseobacterium sp. BGARF1]